MTLDVCSWYAEETVGNNSKAQGHIWTALPAGLSYINPISSKRRERERARGGERERERKRKRQREWERERQDSDPLLSNRVISCIIAQYCTSLEDCTIFLTIAHRAMPSRKQIDTFSCATMWEQLSNLPFFFRSYYEWCRPRKQQTPSVRNFTFAAVEKLAAPAIQHSETNSPIHIHCLFAFQTWWQRF